MEKDRSLESMPDAPIGVFDSGVGGLTVVQAIRRILPQEAILYFGDTARVPYGPKSTDTIRRFARENTRFLKRQGVKMVVVACNTCSATSMDCIADEFPGPVLGVINPGVQAAVKSTHNKRIGVIGTQATIHSGAYEQGILACLPEAKVFSTACPLFVPLAEERMENHPATRLIAQMYLTPLLDQDIDTLILGCTHYPLLKHTLQDLCGDQVAVVDSAETTANAIAGLIDHQQMRSSRTGRPELRFFVSDNPAGFERFFNRLMPEERGWVGTGQPESVY